MNYFVGVNPQAIEAQEKQGQEELVNSSQLPKYTNTGIRKAEAKEKYEELGIKVKSDSRGDDLFVDVEMPKGWKVQATDHSMWSDLVDDKGHKKAEIFYKAAFYDRDAFIRFV